MNVIIAIDSFKGSLSSLDAGMAAAEGIKRAIPDANIAVRPIADGGEGTVEALCVALGGIITEEPIKTNEDLLRILKSGNYKLIKNQK